MSGHSKWSQIKRQKESNDLKKGKIYTKIAKQIGNAAKTGGGDPSTNFSLRMAINKGKEVNMPSDNIEKAIKKGLGENRNPDIAVSYEAYGFGGATLIIDALTDNRNRTAADIRMLVEKGGGRVVEAGSVSWQYDTIGLLMVDEESEEEKEMRVHKKWSNDIVQRNIPVGKRDDFELQCIEIDGVIDVVVETDGKIRVFLYTQPDKLDYVRKGIEKLGYDISQMEIIKKAKEYISLPSDMLEKNKKLIDALEDYDDVDSIWTNVSDL